MRPNSGRVGAQPRRDVVDDHVNPWFEGKFHPPSPVSCSLADFLPPLVQKLNKFPTTNLYAVNDLELYVRLGFSQGAFPDQNLNEYVRLLPMLAGIESPGTLQEVIRGYVGDRDAKQIFDRSPFDVLGKGYQRPFELATLRLANMVGILPNWGELVPNSELICQQGGTLVFQGSSLVHLQKDTGILKYASIDDLLAFLESS